MAGSLNSLAADPLLTRVMADYARAWEMRDADLVLAQFTEDASYQENPFSAPMVRVRMCSLPFWRK